MMKKAILIFLTFSFSLNFFGQVTNEGTPASWDMVDSKNNITSIKLPKLNMKKIQAEDEINDKIRAKPWRFGYKHKVNHGLDNAGSWTSLSNGDRIWRILFESKGALSLNFIFNQFHMPDGGKVYVYSDDRTDLLGAYTAVQNQESGMLGTWLVEGDKIWVEYLEPKNVAGQGKLNIASVTHQYRSAETMKALNDSGACNKDVDCPIGADFESQRDVLKKAVSLILANGSDFCTGTLINNTNEDNKPYILTANHCFFRNDGSSTGANPATLAFRFNWISPTPICSGFTNSTNGPTNMTLSGSTMRVNNSDSDVVLLEINNPIPTDWDVNYAGWDRSGATPSFVVSIHHPSGDIMKIARDNSGVIKSSHSIDGGPVAQTWDITTAGGGWELGVTERGSSGGALFDQNGRIIGQLFGGAAFCNGTNDNGLLDFYGRFDVSWDNGGTAPTQLKDWLDPANTNPVTLDTKQNVLSVNDEFLVENISVFPNPTSGTVNVKATGVVGDLSYEVFNLLGQSLQSDLLQNETIQLNNLNSNIYFIKITEIETNKILVKKVVLSK